MRYQLELMDNILCKHLSSNFGGKGGGEGPGFLCLVKMSDTSQKDSDYPNHETEH